MFRLAILCYSSRRCLYAMRHVMFHLMSKVCHAMAVLGCLISCCAMQWSYCGTEVCVVIMWYGAMGCLHGITLISCCVTRILCFSILLCHEVSRHCAMLCVLSVIWLHREFFNIKIVFHNLEIWLEMNTKHFKNQAWKAGPKQVVLLLFMCGFSYHCLQLFTEHWNPTSNHRIP